MTAAGVRPGRSRALDGLRGLAVALVVGQHWIGEHAGWWQGAGPGVEIFFVLSGFLVTTWLWRPGAAYRPFLRARVVRLVPPTLVLVAVGLVLAAALPVSGVDPRIALRSALITLAHLTAPAAAAGLDLRPFGITWSLTVEWYFYLLWPLVVLHWRRRGTDPARCARVTLVIALAVYAVSLPMPSAWYYFGPLSRFAPLLAGAALALHLGARGPRRLPPAWAATGLAAVVVWQLLGTDQNSAWHRLLGTPLVVAATVATLVVAHDRTAAPVLRVLESPVLVGLGHVSFSLYLWHTLPWTLLTERSTGLGHLPLLGIWAASTALLTALGYVLVERPCHRRARRAPTRPSTAVTPAPERTSP
ncbi:acyltransferase [Actinomycetospora sp. NBRC 106378]|uniref:acyltransferase family protein n=1 Tax=Actinomycetospora sp. NBRC 106378 TaxID=3032208 RepID=UPI0024A5C752|nr:acyltransferase [Actinomycetospora sp. NBRC 106378]GLZ51772.1 hypothetical protein Acsp07_13890 [Actinomycetospora sp. NBRC 106378]